MQCGDRWKPCQQQWQCPQEPNPAAGKVTQRANQFSQACQAKFIESEEPLAPPQHRCGFPERRGSRCGDAAQIAQAQIAKSQ